MALSRRSKALVAGGALLAVAFLVLQSKMCVGAYLRHGFVSSQCPSGDVHQTVLVQASLVRGGPGPVTVTAFANFTTGPAVSADQAPLRRFKARLALVDAKATEVPLSTDESGWRREGLAARATVSLPDVPDGDYRLRAYVTSGLGESKVDVALPLFAPARVHVLTDRPLYEPGNLVRFRALVVKARELSPLDGRPGRWVVTSPSGEELLEEQSPSGAWGVAQGSFPLDKLAQSGTWRVKWVSGAAQEEVSFEVRPFTLPRFRVELSPGKRFFGPGDRLALAGSVRYASGAPVEAAQLTLEWSVDGAWPPPTEWLQGLLPQTGKSGPDGRFTLKLPEVPKDLRGKAQLRVTVTAVDEAQDTVTASSSLLLSQDALAVDAVTELENGLLEGFNNRVYLRVTTPDGEALPNAEVVVRRKWDARDKGVTAVADEDGVAALQLDPGPPVNVLVPPMPVRPAAPEAIVTRESQEELLSHGEPSLADQLALDRAQRALEGCAYYAEASPDEVTVALSLDAAGRVLATAAKPSPLGACLIRTLKQVAFPAGRARLLSLGYSVFGDHLPSLAVAVQGSPETPPWLEVAARRALLEARRCLPRSQQTAELPKVAQFQYQAGAKSVALRWVDAPGPQPAMPEVMACIERTVTSLAVPAVGEGGEEDEERPAPADALGVLHVNAQPGEGEDGAEAPEATTRLGYELAVAAKVEGKAAGQTALFLAPGQVPRVRLRATPTLVEKGGSVTVELLRGPDYRGELTKGVKLYLVGQRGETLEEALDLKARKATFKLPSDASGWWEARFEDARALVFVRGGPRMTVAVKPARERYAPGEKAQLAISTVVLDRPGPAAVGLFGVDDSLSQLVSLPGADELGRLRPQVPMKAPAFGVLDAQALVLGRVSGANAAAATVMKVASLPALAEVATAVSVRAQSVFDPVSPLTEHFYGVLAELEDQARAWQAKAPPGEQAGPELVAKLWSDALAACAKRGEPATDAFGRRLTLARLPADLLALTDPRRVVKDATRLPEDVVNWEAWVQREQP